MGVGIQVGSIVDEMGSPGFFHAFFSTASVRLEPNGWGSRFPLLLNNLYQGELLATQASDALDELNLAQKELGRFAPGDVVWDVEDRTAVPPWGDKISLEITSLANYFVTSNGRDLFELLREVLLASLESGRTARVVQY